MCHMHWYVLYALICVLNIHMWGMHSYHTKLLSSEYHEPFLNVTNSIIWISHDSIISYHTKLLPRNTPSEYMWDITHSYMLDLMRHNLYMYVWLDVSDGGEGAVKEYSQWIYMRHRLFLCMWLNVFRVIICVTWLIHICATWCVRWWWRCCHKILPLDICETWLIHMCVTWRKTWLIHICVSLDVSGGGEGAVMEYSQWIYVRHHWFICVSLDVRHDSFTYVCR